MRIISGKFKGKTINFLKNLNTRPLKDSVKENIFNILCHSKLINLKLNKATILDLYSGVGSFGIECFSRGAKKITFIEQDEDAAKILEKNLIKLSIEKKAKIHINKIENVLNENLKEKFHIIFLDPPFSDIKFLHNLKIIKNKKIFTKNHIIIIHREERSNENIEDLLITIEVKHYGRSRIIFGVFK